MRRPARVGGNVADLLIDVSGTPCPIPILKASEALRDTEEGWSIELVTTDVLASVDVPAWVDDMGYDLKETFEDGDGSIHFVIVKV